MLRSKKIAALALAAAAGTFGLAAPVAGAASSHRVSFAKAQAQLEAALVGRQTQLANLTAEVKAATNLSAATGSTLTLSLTTETANIAALQAKVPVDTTYKQLDADRNSMIHNNRVYAVMTPQVNDSIEAANDTVIAGALLKSETNLGTGIQARKGDRGWQVAWTEFQSMVSDVADAQVDVNAVTPLVLAQIPQGFPKNEAALVKADGDLLHGEVATARASYDRSVIQLFIDGYAAVS